MSWHHTHAQRLRTAKLEQLSGRFLCHIRCGSLVHAAAPATTFEYVQKWRSLHVVAVAVADGTRRNKCTCLIERARRRGLMMGARLPPVDQRSSHRPARWARMLRERESIALRMMPVFKDSGDISVPRIEGDALARRRIPNAHRLVIRSDTTRVPSGENATEST